MLRQHIKIAIQCRLLLRYWPTFHSPHVYNNALQSILRLGHYKTLSSLLVKINNMTG